MSSHQPRPTPEEIDARAQELWQIAGSPPGGPQFYRSSAEAELMKQREVTDRTADDPVSRPPARRSR